MARDRLLLLLPTTTYRTQAFVDAARTLGVDLVCASEQPSTLEAANPSGLITLDFQHPERAADVLEKFTRERPPGIDAVVGVDDDTAIVAAAVAGRLQLKGNPVPAAVAARDKHRQRELLGEAGVPIPRFELHTFDEDPAAISRSLAYPCVLKPLRLSASRGVMRADNPRDFLTAHARLRKILAEPDAVSCGEPSRQFLVEEFISRYEVALEGLLIDGRLQMLAIFDKPDPLEGPYFEETIYVTPSRLGAGTQDAIAEAARRATAALGLVEGPVHAELRIREDTLWVLEVAARSIGGLCSRALTFGLGTSLEELILRHALGRTPGRVLREREAGEGREHENAGDGHEHRCSASTSGGDLHHHRGHVVDLRGVATEGADRVEDLVGDLARVAGDDRSLA